MHLNEKNLLIMDRLFPWPDYFGTKYLVIRKQVSVGPVKKSGKKDTTWRRK